MQAWQVQQARKALTAFAEFLAVQLEEQSSSSHHTHSCPPHDTASTDPVVEATRAELRVRHYARKTEKAYLGWVRRFLRFHDFRPPQAVGPPGVRAFLEHLALELRVAASTQNQALNALVFLYREVLGIGIGDLGDFAGMVHVLG